MTVVVDVLQSKLDEVESEISEKVGNLVSERDELMAAIKKLARSAPKQNGAKASTAAVSDEALIETVRKLTNDGEDAVSSSEIAKDLGVDTRAIARKLAKLAASGVLAGDKELGYSIA